MAVLVTGGAGFVGSYVVRDLLSRGEEVVVYDGSPFGNAIDQVLAHVGTSGLTRQAGEIADFAALRRTCVERGVERIVHLASPLTQAVNENVLDGVRDVCVGTTSVLEIARELELRKVVWTTSVAVFGERSSYPPGPLANDAPHRPLNLYGHCKSLAEQVALHYRDVFGVDSIGLRLTVVYGRARLRGYMSLVSDLISEVARGNDAAFPDLPVPINWQYVEEVARMIVHSLYAGATRDAVFNTNGDRCTFAEAAAVIRELRPDVQINLTPIDRTDATLQMLEDAPNDFDDTQFCNQLGYSQELSLKDGLERMLAAYADVDDVGMVAG